MVVDIQVDEIPIEFMSFSLDRDRNYNMVLLGIYRFFPSPRQVAGQILAPEPIDDFLTYIKF
jgi:hypothetical protein